MFLWDPVPMKCENCGHVQLFPCGDTDIQRKKWNEDNPDQLVLRLPPIVEPMFCDGCGDYQVHSDGACHVCKSEVSEDD